MGDLRGKCSSGIGCKWVKKQVKHQPLQFCSNKLLKLIQTMKQTTNSIQMLQVLSFFFWLQQGEDGTMRSKCRGWGGSKGGWGVEGQWWGGWWRWGQSGGQHHFWGQRGGRRVEQSEHFCGNAWQFYVIYGCVDCFVMFVVCLGEWPLTSLMSEILYTIKITRHVFL